VPKGIPLFRVLGIRISIDYTWFIVFVLFAWSLSFGYYPYYYPGMTKKAYIIMGSVSTILLFVCVLIHELSHSYTANRLGLEVKEITLFIFGGVANLTKEPDDAMTELKIAAAGPAASGVLAALFWVASRVLPSGTYPAVSAVLSYLYLINLLLLGFNAIPGLPLDGGRILRAIWWRVTGNINTATLAASQIGRAFALFLIIFGFFQIFTANFIGGLWMLLIGVFLQQAAAGGYRQLLIRKMLEGVTVRDLMSRDVVTIDESVTVAEAIDEYFMKYHFTSFPVTSGGEIRGLVTFRQVKSVPPEERETKTVGEVMERLGDEYLLRPEMGALEAITKISASGLGRLPVVEGKRPIGMVSRGDVLRVIEMKSSLGG